MLTETHLSIFEGVKRGVGEKENASDQMVITGSVPSPDHEIGIFSNMYCYYLCTFQCKKSLILFY